MGRPLSEAELIDRAKRGDAVAYEALMREHEHVAFRAAYAITRSAADAEEAAQDAFVKAYRALGRFRAGAPFRPWLLRIVANEARNRLRAAGRRSHHEARAAVPEAAAPSPEAAALDAERREQVLAAVDRLRDADRTAILCRFVLDLDDAETAAVLGVRRSAVKMRVFRALERLRQEVGEV